MPRTLRRVVIVSLFAGFGWMVGDLVANMGVRVGSLGWTYDVRRPLPHHVAKYPGGLSLRLAMVHDVIHERFTRHGPEYYQHRNRVVTEELKTEGARAGPVGGKTERYWSLLDDLGAGLGYLGKFVEATALLRDKLTQQQAAGVTGLPLYSTYANLGTFLVIDGIIRGIDNKPGAKELLQEGLGFVKQSIAIKPDAHFGREVWQAVIVEFLIAALDKPELLTRYDMVGNALTTDVSLHSDVVQGFYNGEKLPYEDLDVQRISDSERRRVRGLIRILAAEQAWTAAVQSSHKDPVPFDEPTLGILGMWMLGAGANPHFAVALGEIMLRVGQRHIAWCAYERAVLTADAFLKDPVIRTAFVKRCRDRQKNIEEPPAGGVPGPLAGNEGARLRAQFVAELAYGQAYQRKYQQYEAERIAAGSSIDDPRFYDDFLAKEGRIASPSGPEEFLIITHSGRLFGGIPPLCIVTSGAFALLAGLICRRRDNRAARAAQPAAA